MSAGRKRVFISALENRVGQVTLSPNAIELMEQLGRAGYVLAWTKSFRHYPTILDDIEASDALLAIVDSTWTSSTWTVIEAGYALGLSFHLGRTNPKPVPTFVYPLASSWIARSEFAQRHSLLTILELEVDKALLQIKSQLGPP